MSVENVLAFGGKLKTDPDLRSKVPSIERTPAGLDSLIQIAGDAGFQFTREDFIAALKSLHQSRELTDEQVAIVSGGTVQDYLQAGQDALQNLAAVWGGAGSDAYQDIQDQWNNNADQLSNALNDLANKIT